MTTNPRQRVASYNLPPLARSMFKQEGILLTRQQLATLNLMRGGHGATSIAAELGIGIETAKDYVGTIYNKLNIHSVRGETHAQALIIMAFGSLYPRKEISIFANQTPPRRAVIYQAAQGDSNAVIAEKLGISEWTVRDHLKVVAKDGAFGSRMMMVAAFAKTFTTAEEQQAYPLGWPPFRSMPNRDTITAYLNGHKPEIPRL